MAAAAGGLRKAEMRYHERKISDMDFGCEKETVEDCFVSVNHDIDGGVDSVFLG